VMLLFLSLPIPRLLSPLSPLLSSRPSLLALSSCISHACCRQNGRQGESGCQAHHGTSSVILHIACLLPSQRKARGEWLSGTPRHVPHPRAGLVVRGMEELSSGNGGAAGCSGWLCGGLIACRPHSVESSLCCEKAVAGRSLSGARGYPGASSQH